MKIFSLTDFESRFRLAQVAAMQSRNDDPRIIDIAVFVGGATSRQDRCIRAAAKMVVDSFRFQDNIVPKFEFLTNDKVKRGREWGPSDVTNRFLQSDIHICTTHWHQGNLFFNGDWNIENIRENTELWRYHVGIPNGDYVGKKIYLIRTIYFYNVCWIII